LIIVSGLLKGHFDNRGYFFEGLYDEGPVPQGHLLKENCDGYLLIDLILKNLYNVLYQPECNEVYNDYRETTTA